MSSILLYNELVCIEFNLRRRKKKNVAKWKNKHYEQTCYFGHKSVVQIRIQIGMENSSRYHRKVTQSMRREIMTARHTNDEYITVQQQFNPIQFN